MWKTWKLFDVLSYYLLAIFSCFVNVYLRFGFVVQWGEQKYVYNVCKCLFYFTLFMNEMIKCDLYINQLIYAYFMLIKKKKKLRDSTRIELGRRSILSVNNEQNSSLFIWLYGFRRLVYTIWVVWTTFIVLLCPFWSLKVYIVFSKRISWRFRMLNYVNFRFWMKCLKRNLPSRVLVLRQVTQKESKDNNAVRLFRQEF